ncbi:TPA: YdcF family protein [Vibrio parahaemolyticus]|uniref:YdcF family protein n=1 Tax=Vibrio parahaemolyticus TaxID=670 RepID=UPI00215C0DEF|nr:YdcF family protein [Vibrio parahaemolyticus]MCS0040128.1 YdcF family protein [Vibrio parahaemolyticus]
MKLGNVVIVLGKRLVNNQLSAEGISRVEALAAKIREMPMENTALVFCGGKTQGQSISEADAMYAYFQTLNTSLAKPFPTSQILLENRSLNTFENMQNAAKVLCESGLFPLPSQAAVEVILLSNAYHLERILEIQTLMDEQGLLRVLKSQCASVGLDLHISLDIQKHISVSYPHQGPQAEAFLLLDELTTYRVYLEGVKSGAFQRDLTSVRAQPLLRAKQAINQLRALPLEMDVLQQIAEMKKAIEMTAFDESVATAERVLEVFHPILTALNSRLDPESIQ